MDHLFLRNQTGMNRYFNHARGRDKDAEEVLDHPRDYHRQKERLGTSRTRFISERTVRHEHRSQAIEVAHWDMVEISFLKHVAPDFAKVIDRD
jgi:hypothetical protein